MVINESRMSNNSSKKILSRVSDSPGSRSAVVSNNASIVSLSLYDIYPPCIVFSRKHNIKKQYLLLATKDLTSERKINMFVLVLVMLYHKTIRNITPVNQVVMPNSIANTPCEAGVFVRRVSHAKSISGLE